jgi:S-formylglutathione hydrolase FrmB
MGASMGGYGALKCALSRPEQYGYCCAFSSACLFLRDFLHGQGRQGDVQALKATYGEQLVTDFQAAFGERLESNPRDDILELARNVSNTAGSRKSIAHAGQKTTCGAKTPGSMRKSQSWTLMSSTRNGRVLMTGPSSMSRTEER